MLWDDWARKCFEIHHVRNFCLAVIHRLYFSMHARSLINIPSSFRIPLIFLTLLFITRAHKMISCRYGLHKARGYLFLSNAALHTFTLAKHIPWAGYRPSLVRPAGPGPRASTGRQGLQCRDLFSILSFSMWGRIYSERGIQPDPPSPANIGTDHWQPLTRTRDPGVSPEWRGEVMRVSGNIGNVARTNWIWILENENLVLRMWWKDSLNQGFDHQWVLNATPRLICLLLIYDLVRFSFQSFTKELMNDNLEQKTRLKLFILAHDNIIQ